MENIELKRKCKYSIEINEPSRKSSGKKQRSDEKYSVSFSKNYGNMHGGKTGCNSIEDLKETLRNIVKQWEVYDSTLGRMPDKVTRQNLYFESFTPDVTISDVLGIQTLSSWIE